MKKIIFLTLLLSVIFSGSAYAVDELIMYMPMDDDANDIVGITPYSIWGTEVVSEGKFGNGLVMSSYEESGCIEITYQTPPIVAQGFSAAMWLRSGDTWGAVLFEIPNDNGSAWCNTGAFGIDFPSGQVSVSNGGTNDGSWHHIVCTYDGNRLRAYKDGSLVEESASDLGEAFPATTGDLVFVPGNTPYANWRGMIDDVRIYNYGLSQTEVEDLYAYTPNPAIVTHPESVVVEALGGSETLSVVATNPDGGSTELEYAWYHDDILVAGETNADLVLTSIAMEDLGAYYCVVTYTSTGTTTISNTASITLEVPPAMIMYMPMDDDANDIVGNSPYIVDGPLTLVEGRVGNCLFTANNASECQNVSYDVTLASVGFTAAMWVNTTNDWNGVALLQIPNANGSAYLSAGSPYTGLDYHIDFAGSSVTITCPGAFDGTWHHIICTYDGNRMKIYREGLLVAENGSDIGEMFPYSPDGMIFSPGDDYGSWRGLIDEVKIFSYGLGATEAWDLYATYLDPDLPPDITLQPVSQSVDVGADASLTVAATNPYTGDSSGLEYLWYKDGSPTSETTDTLSITGATYGDAGDYYCQVTITSNSQTANSDVATLSAQLPPQLLIYAPMENTADDLALPAAPWVADAGGSAGFNNVGDYPTWVHSGDYAMEVHNDHSTLNGVDYTQTLDTGAYSLSMWIGQAGGNSGNWREPANFSVGGSVASAYINLNCQSDGYMYHGISWDGAGEINNATSTSLYTAEFHHVVVTYDGSDLRTYVNGVLDAGPTAGNGPMPTFDHLHLGIAFWGAPLEGAYDEVRLYNFGLNADQAMYLYTGEPLCVTPPAYDLDGNCIIDLGDIAMIASAWLEVGEQNLFPELE